jgi:starch synthase
MYVVMIASECAPVAKVGGLGDVVYGLSRELELRGHAVEIVLPKYDCMRYDHIWGLQKVWEDLRVPWFNGFVSTSVWFGFVHGRKCFFIEPHSVDQFFARGAYYGFPDEHMRFAFFSKAALEYMLKSGKRPDVIHTHDWQTALVPTLLYEIYAHTGMGTVRAVHTIHNFKHQGVVGENVLWFSGLGRPEYYYDDNRLRDDFNPTALNLTKGAITYANYTSTVSPQHAFEAQHTDWGYGLGHTLFRFREKFGGILNGLDYEMWNPAGDPYTAHAYSADEIDGKYANKRVLRERLMLNQDYKPLIAYVGRLDTQKGVHLIRHALFYALGHGAQFVLLGSSPELGINNEFWHLKHELNENPDCHLEIGYDEELAHLIYAGADMIVVPSMFEPCGLTQMIALRYGTVPIVRAVGGLVDTVFDHDFSDKPQELRNGFVFQHADFHALESAMDRAIGLWNHHPEEFRALILRGMGYDYSWKNPGQDYVNVYDWVRHK